MLKSSLKEHGFVNKDFYNGQLEDLINQGKHNECFFRDQMTYGIRCLISANKALGRNDEDLSFESGDEGQAPLVVNDKIKFMHIVIADIPQEADKSKTSKE
jgi:hypothetical protein